MDDKKILFREKPTGIFVLLLKAKLSGREIIVMDLQRELNLTYSHALKLVSIYNDNGLVSVEKIGRKKVINLTKNGEFIAETINKILLKVTSSH